MHELIYALLEMLKASLKDSVLWDLQVGGKGFKKNENGNYNCDLLIQ